MINALLFISGVLAVGGLVIIFDFLLWEFQGTKIPALIRNFRPARFVAMPVLEFSQGQNTFETPAARIDAIGYFLSRPEIGGRVRGIVRQTALSQPPQIRVYGYGPLVLALLLIVPLLIALALWLANPVLLERIYYMMALAGIIGGGFALLKIIRLMY